MKVYIDKLRIRDVKHLAKLLRTSPKELDELCNNISTFPQKYYIQWYKEDKKGKKRPMVKICGRLREILDELKNMLQRIKVPAYIHGGIKGKSTITNAKPHMGKPMLMRYDLEKHFPTTTNRKVYTMFRDQQECSPDVARILTRLTTLNSGLPQGSPTSTLISNLVTLSLSRRLKGFAKARAAKCTQYVDDYNFSGKLRLAKHRGKILQIIEQEGFKCNPSKTTAVPAQKEQIVTGIRVNGKHPDVPSANLKDIQKNLGQLQQQVDRGLQISPKIFGRLEGKICYVRRLNRGATKPLQRKLRNIKLKALELSKVHSNLYFQPSQ